MGTQEAEVLNVSLAPASTSRRRALLPTLGGAFVDAAGVPLVDVLVVRTPPLDAVCPSNTSAASACDGADGYKPLTLENPLSPGSVAAGAVVAARIVVGSESVDGVDDFGGVALDGMAGGRVQCPPHCPGSADDVTSHGGVYFTPVCVGFTEDKQACLVPSTARQCAVGSGDTCERCPVGALCPGGDRVWPLPGFWNSAEADRGVVPCRLPSTERCLGWDYTAAAPVCGVGYNPRSPSCSACAKGYYKSSQRCVKCPEQSVNALLVSLTYMAVIIGGIFVVVFAVVVIVVRSTGGTVADGFSRTVDFVAGMVTIWQIMVQVRCW
jgi:hypothetical protein